MDFDHQLRNALERTQPSADFAGRVIRAAGKATRRNVWAAWKRWIAVPIAASILVLAVGIEQQRRQRIQGEAAKAQLIQAFEITSGKLGRIQKKVRGVLK